MNGSDFSLAIAFGLAGSLHCVQMCGPVVLSFGMPMTQWPQKRQAAGHLFYHAGRIATYGLMGAVAGYFGQAIGMVTKYQQAASLAAGALMVLAGLLMWGVIRRPSLIQIGPAQGLVKRAGRLIRAAGLWSKLGVGTLMGFLPCGMVYAALLKAMAPADPVEGALTMVGFGLGTAGPLVILGLFSTTFSRKLSRWGPQLTAAAVLAMGVFLVMRGLAPVTLAGHVHQH